MHGSSCSNQNLTYPMDQMKKPLASDQLKLADTYSLWKCILLPILSLPTKRLPQLAIVAPATYCFWNTRKMEFRMVGGSLRYLQSADVALGQPRCIGGAVL
jgi:hypothetical protein